ncbi:MFS general substrate transporter [Penicillium hispanicum]|uniref:MFS general substrate transporter n=1 Tax=Penicillium hispanicum TaxID=1080232 RepID=UPI0025407D93|nr:MFS general substrate transporter [Penicillium hispanicum]KAJ5595531.1 MFS general substrate transporter [Penicillium hispanicum]
MNNEPVIATPGWSSPFHIAPLLHCLRQRRPSRGAVMESTEQTVENASPTLFEMEERRQLTRQQKPVPAEPDTDPVGTEGGQGNKPPRMYLTGWKLWLLTIGVWIALFLSTIETTIVSTSLVSITNALNGFLVKDWVVTAYLLTYTGFLTIFAKFSDIFGRKTMLILALSIFSLASLLCGISNSIVELIIFRAFQGIGASGIYSMVMVIAPGMVPPEKYGKYMAIVSTVFIVASVLGPILGGVINTHSSWRWVFLFNVPGGLVALVLIVWCLPTSETSSRLKLRKRLRTKLSKSEFMRVDICGMFLLLASSVLLVFTLEEGGSRYPWDSAAIIVPLVLAIIAAIVLAGWEVFLEKKGSVQEPLFPPSILKNRLLTAMLLTAFFVGFPFVAIVVNVPQRAQAVSGLSPLRAGLALLPLLLTSPFATALSGFLTGNMKVPPFYLIFGASVLQLIGVGLSCSYPTDQTEVPPSQYGFEVIMGIGFGMGLTTILTFARTVVEEKHTAIVMGAITQLRVLGGTISLAICSTILNNHVKPGVLSIVSPGQAQAIFDSLSAIQDLTVTQQSAVKRAFAEGYNLQNIFMTALTAVGLLTACFLWERHPRKAV